MALRSVELTPASHPRALIQSAGQDLLSVCVFSRSHCIFAGADDHPINTFSEICLLGGVPDEETSTFAG